MKKSYSKNGLNQNLQSLIALISLIIFSPVFVIISLLIKFSSKGPIFFKQERIGRYGKPFIIYKFWNYAN